MIILHFVPIKHWNISISLTSFVLKLTVSKESAINFDCWLGIVGN